MKRTLLLALAVAASTATVASADHLFEFGAIINGDQQVPANASPAMGNMTGTYDSIANSFTFSWDISDNLIGMPSSPGAHIHQGAAGTNGPVLLAFNNPDGTWGLSGSDTWTDLTDSQVDALFNGGLYLNFHTDDFPGGEVRGQIFAIPAPGATGILAGAGLMALRRRRRA